MTDRKQALGTVCSW